MHLRKLSRREFFRLSASWTMMAAAGGIGGATYSRDVEPKWLDIERVRLRLPRLPSAFDGYRIAQITDIHMGDWTDRTRLLEVVTLVNSLKPDLVAITGDFVTKRAERSAEDLAVALAPLKANDGVVAVLGNHDQGDNAPIIRRVLQMCGILELANTAHTLERGGTLLNIAGVDDVWHKKARLEQVLQSLPAEGAALLLAHEPDFADTSAATGRFDLQISGHSHGGQVVVPFYGPGRLPHMGRKYPSGLYRVGEMYQYTNRGIGMVRPHVRLNCRPEITLFTLMPAHDA